MPRFPDSSLSFTANDLRRALEECFVPALRRDVVAAGLVQSSSLELDTAAPGAGIAGVPPRWIAHVTLTAPGSEDAVNAQVRASVENRLLGLAAISRVDLKMVAPLFPILS